MRLDHIGRDQQAVNLEYMYDARKRSVVNCKSTCEDHMSKFLPLGDFSWHVSAHQQNLFRFSFYNCQNYLQHKEGSTVV